MRKEFSNSVEQLATDDESIVFITGDLGYNALENLQQLMGPRFINAGVADQNVWNSSGMTYAFITFRFTLSEMVADMVMVLWVAAIMPLKIWRSYPACRIQLPGFQGLPMKWTQFSEKWFMPENLRIYA